MGDDDKYRNYAALREEAVWAAGQCEEVARRLRAALDGDEEWAFPIGSQKYPPEGWYIACWHDETGKRNAGYRHTGIDLNVAQWPRGDIDRGQPVFAVADGVVVAHGYSQNYLGGVVIEVQHAGAPLYVRYWHLAGGIGLFPSWSVGQPVREGDCLGEIGNYTLGAGGDHLHFDVALDPFRSHWWFTNHPEVRWVNPLPILYAHLDDAVLDAIVANS